MDISIPLSAALLLNFIYDTETSKCPPACYEVIYGNKQHKLAKPLTKMTLDEVIAAQVGWSKNHKSSAAGAPQFMRATLKGLISELRLNGSQLLDGNLQDRLAYHLLKRRGYREYMAGKISRTQFGKLLAQEWASFPVLEDTRGAHRDVKRGQSYYAGDNLNKSLVSPQKVEAVLDRMRLMDLGTAVPIADKMPASKPTSHRNAAVVLLGIVGAATFSIWTWITNLPCSLVNLFCGG